MKSSRCLPNYQANDPQTTPVDQTRSQHCPHADIQTQNTTQSGDNSPSSVRSQDSSTDMSEDVVTETDTDSEILSDQSSGNKSKIY